MSYIAQTSPGRLRGICATFAGATVLVLSGALAAEEPEARVTRNAFYSESGRAQQVPDRITEQTRAPEPGDTRSDKTRRGEASKSLSGRAMSLNSEFWFYDVDLVLFGDHDNDGYFHGIDLLFDADTIYERADVYAVLYLSENGGPWFEYAATDVFPIFGATADDDFVVVSELVAGYPSGSYDLLIELWDTWDETLVAEIGPADTSALAFVPLEDTERDAPAPPDVIIVEDGGGSMHPFGILLLAGLAVRRCLVRRKPSRPARSGPCA